MGIFDALYKFSVCRNQCNAYPTEMCPFCFVSFHTFLVFSYVKQTTTTLKSLCKLLLHVIESRTTVIAVGRKYYDYGERVSTFCLHILLFSFLSS